MMSAVGIASVITIFNTQSVTQMGHTNLTLKILAANAQSTGETGGKDKFQTQIDEFMQKHHPDWVAKEDPGNWSWEEKQSYQNAMDNLKQDPNWENWDLYRYPCKQGQTYNHGEQASNNYKCVFESKEEGNDNKNGCDYVKGCD